MTKAIMVDGMYAKAELPTKVLAENIYDALLESVREALFEEDSVILTGIGSFHVVDRAARTGRNPGTGESIAIPARKVVRFTMGKKIQNAVAGR